MKIYILIFFLFLSVSSYAADNISKTSLPQLRELIEHMKDFNTEKVSHYIYYEPMLKMGATSDQLKAAATQLNKNLKNAGAIYSSFKLGMPTDIFEGPDGIYTLIPYTSILSVYGQTMEQHAFFIGVTNDGGNSWLFLDGVATSQVPIDVIIPNYSGPALPYVSRRVI